MTDVSQTFHGRTFAEGRSQQKESSVSSVQLCFKIYHVRVPCLARLSGASSFAWEKLQLNMCELLHSHMMLFAQKRKTGKLAGNPDFTCFSKVFPVIVCKRNGCLTRMKLGWKLQDLFARYSYWDILRCFSCLFSRRFFAVLVQEELLYIETLSTNQESTDLCMFFWHLSKKDFAIFHHVICWFLAIHVYTGRLAASSPWPVAHCRDGEAEKRSLKEV